MALVNIAILKGSNKEVRESIVRNFNQVDVNNKGDIWVRAKRLELHNLLLKLSEEQEEVIKARHCFSVEQFDRTHITEYHKGQYKVVGYEVNYVFMDFTPPIGYTREEIENKVIESIKLYFIDGVSIAPDGLRLIIRDIEKAPLIIPLSEEYMIKVTKQHNLVDVEVYEKTIKWEKIE